MSAIGYTTEVPDYTKNRNVRITFDALQIFYDIDINHSMHPATCIELMNKAFAGLTRVTETLASCNLSASVKEKITIDDDDALWKREAKLAYCDTGGRIESD